MNWQPRIELEIGLAIGLKTGNAQNSSRTKFNATKGAQKATKCSLSALRRHEMA
jgi:hypothetical protein